MENMTNAPVIYKYFIYFIIMIYIFFLRHIPFKVMFERSDVKSTLSYFNI